MGTRSMFAGARAMRRYKAGFAGCCLIVLVAMLAFASVASAELDAFSTGDGHEGAYTIPAGTTTLNYVAPLTASASAGASSLTIGTVRASGAAAAAAQFEAGRLV